MRKPLIAFIALAALAAAQPKEAAPATRETQWRQDLQFFAEHFSKGHCTPADLFHSPLTAFQPCHQADFDKLYPQPAFDNEIHAIEESIPNLSDGQIVLRLARLVAGGKVGHTYVQVPALRFGFRPLPLGLRWFSDGLAVISATPPYTAALGARVMRIGSLTPEQALAAVAPYISYENRNWLRTMSAEYLTKMAVIRELGAVEGAGGVKFTLAKPGGAPFTLDVLPREANQKTVSMYDELHIPPTLFRKHTDSYYWYEYLPDSRALYIQYNRCANDLKQSFGDFVHGLFAATDGHPVDRAIVDLCFNGGGNSLIIHSLKSGLKSRRYSVFVLIGDGIFSSAQDNAIELRRELNATLVGDATGEKPNGYGEVRQLKLPNSGLRIQYSTEYFHLIKGSDPDALYPDIPAPRTLEDVLAGAIQPSTQPCARSRTPLCSTDNR